MTPPRRPSRGRTIADLGLAACAWTSAALVALAFAAIVGDLLLRGLDHLSWQFLVDTPRDSGRSGGILSIVVSTAMILAVCLGVSLPIGVGTAAVLADPRHARRPGVRLVRRSTDLLAGVPSIVFGLFGNALFCLALGLGFSILSGGLTLACMVLPLVIRSTEEALRGVADHRLTAAALGIADGTSLRRILLPAAAPGLAAGVVLAVGRALAETAALIFTSGYVDRMPVSWLDSGRALSVHIYDLAMNVPGGDQAAYASAAVLVTVLLAINLAAGALARRYRRRLS